MEQRWKDKVKEWKNDPGIVRAVKILAVCIVTVAAYVTAGRLIPGITGLVLRGLCAAVLIYILYQVNKSK